MYVARILYPVNVLGPGDRIEIWFSGCIHKCLGCSNPELWEQKKNQYISVDGIMKLISSVADTHKVDGFTLTGGDPFYQPEALRELLPLLNTISDDILVYTGYKYEILSSKYEDILMNISVLVDGKYEEELNTGAVLKGSDNQRIICLKNQYEEIYKDYLSGARSRIQNFHTESGTVSVGIHLPEYENKLQDKIIETKLEKRI